MKLLSWMLAFIVVTLAARSHADAPATPGARPPTAPAANAAPPRSAANTDEAGCFLPTEWFSRPGRSIYSFQRLAGLQIDGTGHRDQPTAHPLFYVTRGASPFNLPMFGYDKVLGERVTLGVAAGGLVSRFGMYFEGLARVGYIAPLSSRIALSGRGGIGSVNGPTPLWSTCRPISSS